MISKNHYVRSFAEIILVCASQGLALGGGHGDNTDHPNKSPGNFRVSKHDDVRKRLINGTRIATFLYHAIQNELIEVMAGR